MNAIRDHIVKTKGLSVVSQVDPMLATNAKDFLDYSLEKPWLSESLKTVWSHPDYVIEPKLDGIRVKAHFHPSFNGIIRLDSRRRSDVNFVFAEKTENFPYMSEFPQQLPEQLNDMILDGEFMPPPGVTKMWNPVQQIWVEQLQICTSIWNSGKDTSQYMQANCKGALANNKVYEGPMRLHYFVFDIIKFNGQWCHFMKWSERHEIKKWVMNILTKLNPYYHLVPSWDHTMDRLKMFEEELDGGGEGIMLKHVGYPYEMGKRVDHIYKLKKFMTVDAFVTGSVPSTKGKAWENMIGAFELSLKSGDKDVHIASCSSMTLAERAKASLPDGTLNPAYLGKVAEVRMQQMTSRSNRGRHAVMVRWREDKSPEECGIDQLVEAPSEMMTDI